jgi:hypothetical protein
MPKLHLRKDRLYDLKKDWAFKAVFGKDTPKSRGALKSLLEANLGRRIEELEILQNEPPPDSERDRQVRYDFACKFFDHERANIEMTVSPTTAEAWKIEWLLYKLHLTQEIKGKDMRFGNLTRTYHLSFLGGNMYHKDDEPFHSFEFYDKKHGVSFGGLTSINTVELKKVDGLANVSPESLTQMERRALFLRFANEREKQDLVGKLTEREEGIAMAVETINGFTKEEDEAIRAVLEEKYILDMRQREYDRIFFESEQKRYESELRQATAQLDHERARNAQLQAEIERLKASSK